MKNFLFIGAGNIAYAIINGMRNRRIFIHDKIQSQYEKFDKSKAAPADDLKQAVAAADFIVLSVKPQNFEELLADIKNFRLGYEGKVFVSIGAGISCNYICRELGKDVPVVRAMPNTPLLVGSGVTAVTRNAFVPDEAFNEVKEIFAENGSVIEIQESEMNAVISVTSSAPAYIFYIIDAIRKEAESQEINNPELLKVICDMVKGAAEMVIKTKKEPQELIRAVCSPGGTTERAMEFLKEKELEKIISGAMKACTARAEEMEK